MPQVERKIKRVDKSWNSGEKNPLAFFPTRRRSRDICKRVTSQLRMGGDTRSGGARSTPNDRDWRLLIDR